MRLIRILPLLLLAAACSSDPLGSAARGVEVSATLAAADGHTLDVDVQNRGPRTVYVGACDDRIVAMPQRRVNGEWQGALGYACLAIYSSRPVALPPGARAQATVSVAEPGQYRVAVLVYAEPDGTRAEPATSSSITITD